MADNPPQQGFAEEQADMLAQTQAMMLQMQQELQQLRAERVQYLNGQQGQQQQAPAPAAMPQAVPQAMPQAQEPAQPRARGIGATDTPHRFYQNRAAICPPPIQRQDYEIKPQMIALVKQHTFHGLAAENPGEHIENFEEICSTVKSNGVPDDYIKCKLFPFSLADKASRWLKSLPAGSLTTWDQCRAAFLDHYFTKAKTAALRNKITSFGQHSGETFCEAWERFKEYKRECPHHGYTDDQLLSIFYDGVDWDFKNALNAASNGDFMTQTTQGAYQLIENLAASSNSRSAEYDRSRRVNSVDAQKIDELNAKISLLLKGNQRGVQMVEGGTDAIRVQGGTEEYDEVNYMSGEEYGQNRDFNQNYRSHPNLSYRSTNVENPQDQIYPAPQVPQRQPLQQRPFGQNQNQGFQKSYPQQYQQRPFGQVPSNQFQGYQQKQPAYNHPPAAPFPPPVAAPQDDLKAMMQQLLVQQQKSASEINVKVDSMYSDLNGKIEAVSTHLKLLDTQVAQNAEAVKRQQGTLPGKTDQNPKREVYAVTLRCDEEIESAREDEFAEETVSPPSLERVYIPRIPYPTCPERVYVPKIPYPAPPRLSQQDLDELDCKEVLKECTAAPEEKLVPKLSDPGRIELSVQIGDVSFADSLCDLGSGVNLMSLSAAKQLGLNSFKPTKITLEFADHSEKLPVGVLENIHIRVGDVLIPTDFVVLELGDKPKDPLILGRPFLCTAGAMVDVRRGRIDLHLGDSTMTFEQGRLFQRSDFDGQLPSVDALLETSFNEHGVLLKNTRGCADIPRSGPDKLHSPLFDPSCFMHFDDFEYDLAGHFSALSLEDEVPWRDGIAGVGAHAFEPPPWSSQRSMQHLADFDVTEPPDLLLSIPPQT